MVKSALLLTALCLSSCAHSESVSILVEPQIGISHDGTLREAIGIETLGGVFTPLLAEGCKVPCVLSQTFSTAEDDQGQILIHLFSGDAPLAKSTRALGEFEITGITPMPRGEPSIRVEFKADKGGITLTATDTKGQSRIALSRVAP